MSSSDQLLDKRIIERNLAKGLVTKKDIENNLASLADASENAEYLNPEESLAEELEPTVAPEEGDESGDADAEDAADLDDEATEAE